MALIGLHGGDGEHLLKFQIASNPVEVEVNLDLDMLKIEEYNDCVDNIVGGTKL